jgi:hypothetical protein
LRSQRTGERNGEESHAAKLFLVYMFSSQEQKYCNLVRSRLQYCWNGTDGSPIIGNSTSGTGYGLIPS